MPLPITVVTLVDDDGDEFPIALPGHSASVARDFEDALREAQNLIEQGHLIPNGKLRLEHIEWQ